MHPHPHIHGLIAAPFTPMHPNGDLQLEKVKNIHGFLHSNGVKGAFICGSTGEHPSLQFEEKKALINEWAKYTSDHFSIIALVGGNCGADAKALMKYANEKQLDAVSIVAPNYFPLGSVEALVDYCAEIAAVVPEMPVYYYHIPVLTGAHFSMLRFLELAHKSIPNLVGIKYTEENLMEFRLCQAFAEGKYDILWGRDEVLISGLAIGAKGAVGSTYNYAAPLYLEIIKAFEAGQMAKAQSLQQQSIEMIQLLGKYGGIAVGKSFQKLVGMDCGEFRSPVQNPSSEQFAALKGDAERIGFFDYCSK
ncbi:MAG: dihydrodipicolinate synthase family protein [Bacteroidia bacterium]